MFMDYFPITAYFAAFYFVPNTVCPNSNKSVGFYTH